MWGVGGLTRRFSFKASCPTVKASDLEADKPDNSADKPQPWKDMNGMQNLGVLELDPYLAPHRIHLRSRVREFMKRKMEIEKHEGSLEDFAEGSTEALAGYCVAV